MIVPAVTVLLALVTFGAGLKAARLWLDASRSPEQVGLPPTRAPNLHIARIEGELLAVAQMNSQAAIWTAWAAGLGAVTSIWSVLAPLVAKALDYQ